MEKNFVKKIFFHEKPVEMLIVLKNEKAKYATQVAKAVDCTYSHTVKTLEFFKKLGLVEFEKKGRVKYIKLTPLGEELAHDLEGIVKKLSHIEENLRQNLSKKKEK
jgi:predicted transcriptional regulator